jgi:alpha-glucosidase (family GH31 glycosyl hydrolase)
MYFIMRGTASEIISKYHALIGYSMMPPYYALGLFQGSNSYNTQE